MEIIFFSSGVIVIVVGFARIRGFGATYRFRADCERMRLHEFLKEEELLEIDEDAISGFDGILNIAQGVLLSVFALSVASLMSLPCQFTIFILYAFLGKFTRDIYVKRQLIRGKRFRKQYF